MSSRAVINSGPLIALSLINRLDLLPLLFSKFWIPETVFREVAIAGLGKPGASPLHAPEWQARIWKQPLTNPLLIMELDAGESAVITLVQQLSPCLAVIDERRGRRIAQQVYQIPVKGTAGLLVEAVRSWVSIDVRGELTALRSRGYFISEPVIEAAARAAE